MIYEACRIEAFVETVKGKETWEVLTLAIEEADRADRRVHQDHQGAGQVLRSS